MEATCLDTKSASTADQPRSAGTASSLVENRLKAQIQHADDVLSNFSDTATNFRPGRRSLWNNTSSPPLSEITRIYAPVGLEHHFQDLYRILHPCLVQRTGNASAFLQGARGSGKSTLLRHCLAACTDELQQQKMPPFRTVSLHGIAVPGKHVSLVLTEILTQLSAAAFGSNRTSAPSQGNPNDKETQQQDDDVTTEPANKRQRKQQSSSRERLQELLRLRKNSSFTNNIQLLNETLEIASVDGVPILFVLDELDAFLSSSSEQRQVLLYHLLDRVSTAGSLCSFCGLTANQGTVRRLEKRIRSRAEGSSKFLHFGPCPSYEDLVQRLLENKLTVHQTDNHTDNNNGAADRNHSENNGDCSLKDQVAHLLRHQTNDDSNQQTLTVAETLERDFRLGKDMRWFCRVLQYAITLYRHDCRRQLDAICCSQSLAASKGASVPRDRNDENTKASCITSAELAESTASSTPRFDTDHLIQAMMDMEASFSNADGGDRDLVLIKGVPVDFRIQVLCDLTGPQVALLLAARRILARDGHRHEATNLPLTLDRMLEEYRTSYRGSHYSAQQLMRAFFDLLELDVVRPASDHSGTIPWQYMHDDRLMDMDSNTMAARVPLHLTVDIHRELQKVLEKNLLKCSTALREWGRKMN